MARFRTKLCEIDAVQFDGTPAGANVVFGIFDIPGAKFVPATDRLTGILLTTGTLLIPTLEGDHIASPGDWIVRGLKGEFYPVKPDIFTMKYEEVPRDLPAPAQPAPPSAAEPERIDEAAVRRTTFGANHAECFGELAVRHGKVEQGFITSTGRFVDRVEALKIATAAGQVRTKHPPLGGLTSEDLLDCPAPAQPAPEEPKP